MCVRWLSWFFVLSALSGATLPSVVSAATSNWIGSGSDFNSPGNWDNGVPTDVAAFGSASSTAINITQSTTLNEFLFNPSAPSYTITVNVPYAPGVGGFFLNGAGIVNNSGRTQTLIVDSGNGNGLAGTATLSDINLINHDAYFYFTGSSNAGNASITNTGPMYFQDTSTAGNATITNTGTLYFDDTSTTGNAAIVNNGTGIISAAWRGTTRTMNVRSLAGSGRFFLSGMTWVTGSDNTDTTIDGAISGQAVTRYGPIDDNSYEALSTLVKVGTGTLTLTGANTYRGGTTIYGGTLKGNTLGLQGNILNESALVFDQSTTGSFDGVISGTGTVTKTGSGTVIFSAANTYTGITAVNAGELSLRDSISSDVNITAAGVLSGVGEVGQIANTGIVAPGVAGSGALRATSYSGAGTLRILMIGSSHPSLVVSGNADLSGGTLSVDGANRPGEYDVVSAGSITGEFASTPVSERPFLTYNTHYTPTDVIFTVSRSSVTFSSCARTENQRKVAGALDRASVNHPEVFGKIIDAVAGLTSSEAQAAYAQMSGDALTSFRSAGLGGSDHFVRQMNNRANPAAALLQANADPKEPILLAYAGDITGMNLIPSASSSEHGLWTRGVGVFDHTDADASMGSPSSDANTAGFQTGYDVKLGETGLLGLSAGYSETSLSVGDRSSSGHANTLQIGSYGRCMLDRWILNGSLSYSQADNHNSRNITFPGVNETAAAHFDSHVYTAFVEAGYIFHPRPTLSLIPLVSVRDSYLEQDGYSETGAPGLNLAVDRQSSDSVVSSAGLELSRVFNEKSAHPFELGMNALWQRELADRRNSISAEFVDAPGAPFTVQSTPEKRDALAAGFGGRIVLYKNLQSFFDYSGTMRSGQRVHSILGGVSVRW